MAAQPPAPAPIHATPQQPAAVVPQAPPRRKRSRCCCCCLVVVLLPLLLAIIFTVVAWFYFSPGRNPVKKEYETVPDYFTRAAAEPTERARGE